MAEHFGISTGSAACAPLELKAVWDVQADSSYSVSKTPRAADKDYILIHTRAGLGRLILNDRQEFTLFPDSVIAVKENRIVKYWCEGNTWDFIWVVFGLTGVAPFVQEKLWVATAEPSERGIITEVIRLLRRNSQSQRRIATAKFAVLLYSWCANAEAPNKSPHSGLVEKLIEQLHDSFARNWTVEEMADVAGITPRHFRRVFTDVTGEPPKQYYDRIRMETAQALLESKLYNVGEIALKLGFNSPFHFSNTFKKYFGISPSQCIREE